jgi:hypothetical protein
MGKRIVWQAGRQKDKKIKRQSERADSKNPKQSQVAQLVIL